MFLVTRKEKGSYQGIAQADSYVQAEAKMMEEAQKRGKISTPIEGTYLVKKGSSIEEYKGTAKLVDKGFFGGGKVKEIISEYVAKYKIIEFNSENSSININSYVVISDELVGTEKQPTHEIVGNPTVVDNASTEKSTEKSTETSDKSPDLSKNETQKDDSLLKVVVMFGKDEQVLFGLADDINISQIKKCSLDDIKTHVLDICKSTDYPKLNDVVEKKLTELNDMHKQEHIDTAKKLVQLLSEDRAVNYKSWKNVCYALHSIDDSLLSCFIEFSRKYAHKHSVETTIHLILDNCEYEWKNVNDKKNPFTIGSLHSWAMTDNPEEYLKLYESIHL